MVTPSNYYPWHSLARPLQLKDRRSMKGLPLFLFLGKLCHMQTVLPCTVSMGNYVIMSVLSLKVVYDPHVKEFGHTSSVEKARKGASYISRAPSSGVSSGS